MTTSVRPETFTRFRLAAKMERQGLFAWLIWMFTRGRPVHTELVFNDDLSYSAGYERTGAVGTRFTRHVNFDAPGMWHLVELPVALAARAFDFCEREQGCGYDYFGILFGWTLGFRPSPTRWFCSEVCAAALQYADPLLLGVDQTQYYTPRRLWVALQTPRPVAQER